MMSEKNKKKIEEKLKKRRAELELMNKHLKGDEKSLSIIQQQRGRLQEKLDKAHWEGDRKKWRREIQLKESEIRDWENIVHWQNDEIKNTNKEIEKLENKLKKYDGVK